MRSHSHARRAIKLKSLAFAALLASSADAFELDLVAANLNEDLRGASLLVSLAKAPTKATAQDVIAAAQADYARLVGVMYEQGYFAPQISILIDGREAASLSPLRPPRLVRRVSVRAETGKAFRFGTARVTPLPQGATLPRSFARDQRASTGVMQEAVDSGITAWRNQGHAKAELIGQSIIADHPNARLNAHMRLDPGARLRFGQLNVTGNTRMRSARIRDIAGLPTGAVFSPEEVKRAAARLRRSGVFATISLSEAEQISPPSTLDIDGQFTEAKPRRFGFGAELSTQDGLALSGFWLHRNLLGGGERLRLGAQIKGIGGETAGNDYDLTFAFSRPATFGKDVDFYTDGEIASLNEPNFTAERASIEAGLRQYASPERLYELGLGFTAARTTDSFGTNAYRILTLPLSAEFDYRDDKLSAREGYYVKAGLTPFANLRGTASGARGELDARLYRSTARSAARPVTFALRAQLGSVTGPSLGKAPADFLFYSGGGGTVRGHAYHALGVDLGGGNVSGGKSFAGLSGEIRVQTGDKLSLVGFYDAALIGRGDLPFVGASDWHSGAGFGLRYDTGIGPIRLDLASPLGTPFRAGGIKIYIGIGQSF